MAHIHDRPLSGLLHHTASLSRAAIMNLIRKEKWYYSDFRPPYIGVIHFVGKNGPVAQKEIAQWMGLDPSDVVAAIDSLEINALVQRQRDPSDRRRQLVSLTKKGEIVRKRLRELGNISAEETLTPLNARERATLRDLLSRVVDHHHYS